MTVSATKTLQKRGKNETKTLEYSRACKSDFALRIIDKESRNQNRVALVNQQSRH
jgi:hypothetical protein